jgi:hypothetical protein
MRLRYDGTCCDCEVGLPAGTRAEYDRVNRTVRCLVCAGQLTAGENAAEATMDAGIAGASARREYERRKAGREDRIRSKHPKLGGLILALTADPQSTKAWDTGAVGEERLGGRLDALACEDVRVLHDRRIPGTPTNIDHLAVTRSGVYVIDAKKYDGRPKLKVEGGLFRPRVEKLLVGSRDRTKLVDGMLRQLDVVRGVLGDDVPIHGVLCFVDADWPLAGGSFTTQDVDVLWPRKLQSRLRAEGPLDKQAVSDVRNQLARALPAA